ncbi:ImmA/IrrE family metallo-endopeptidase [Nitrosomonas ureae]|uniref:IrrE N-terminal-like domain-containing protein n=1 Tax=Nitrosomonas ureae TaxID=44577 RepID=A0A1H9HHI3_9PROT|nr:ImmA/IrrE family metallo-endopeptidase [Nitrosomonas ureae]SEQ61747.1 protein of unknown function [Nitrosomonas ureae]
MKEPNPRFDDALSLLTFLKENKSFDIRAPIDIDRVAQELGICVEFDISLQQKDIIGEIFFVDEKPIVKINPLQNSYSPRRRFTLAHEIGHYCLHSADSKRGFVDSQKTMSRTESYWDSYESEANSFAAQLLMPFTLLLEEGTQIIAEYLSRELKKTMPTGIFIEVMADKFGVSSKAMEYRLKNIGVIDNLE